MAGSDVVPIYYYHQNYNSKPLYFETRANIKFQRKSGKLNGGYQHNGKIFILFTSANPIIKERQASAFRDAWSIRPSGDYGPLVWQYKS